MRYDLEMIYRCADVRLSVGGLGVASMMGRCRN